LQIGVAEVVARLEELVPLEDRAAAVAHLEILSTGTAARKDLTLCDALDRAIRRVVASPRTAPHTSRCAH
jgi:hypothetical protein